MRSVMLFLVLFDICCFMYAFGNKTQITLLPMQTIVFAKEATTLTCEILNKDINSYYSISWYNRNVELSKNTTVNAGVHDLSVECNFTSNIHTLTIEKANPKDTGEYTCKVCFNLSDCSVSPVVNVNVYTSPADPECKEVSDVTEGEKFNFTCLRPDDSKPSALEIWVIYATNGKQKQINKSKEESANMLIAEIDITSHLHKATLCCIARFFPFANTTSCASSPLNVSYPPKIISTTITYYSIADNTDKVSNASILVDITSNPAATVTWSIYEDNMNELMSYGVCTRVNILYTCVIQSITIGTVVNILGENVYGKINHSITLTWDIEEASTYSTTTDYASKVLNGSRPNITKNDNNIIFPISIILTTTGVIIIILITLMLGIKRLHEIKRKNRSSFRLDILDELGPSNQATGNTYEILQTKTNSVTTDVNNTPEQVCGRSTLRLDRRTEDDDHRSQAGHRSISTPCSTSSESDKYESENMLADRTTSNNAENLVYLEIDHSKFENENLRRLQVKTSESVEYAEIAINN